MRVKFLLILFYCLFVSISFSQKEVINDITHFQIYHKNDTIDFIVADTQFDKRKPILLFCQGSQPIPLVFQYPNGKQWIYGGGISNFNYKELSKDFYIVVVSMPNTPFIAKTNQLNNNFAFIEDTTNRHSYVPSYLIRDRIETYIERANTVLDFIFSQKWAIKKELTVLGHSQGAKVALGITLSRKDVQYLGLLSFNPFGRMDEKIRQLRKDVDNRKLNWEYADKKMREYYQFVKDYNNKDTLRKHPEYISWQSFSKNFIEDIVSVKCPIYIAYGTEDLSAELCDLLPIYFEGKEKHNYVLKRYIGLDHNFFPKDSSNDPKISRWPEVVSKFHQWILSKQ